MTGSPISDLNPIFLAAGCCLQIGSVNGETEVKFDENFYTGSEMETKYSGLPSIRLKLINLGATSINKISEVRLSDEIGEGGLKF